MALSVRLLHCLAFTLSATYNYQILSLSVLTDFTISLNRFTQTFHQSPKFLKLAFLMRLLYFLAYVIKSKNTVHFTLICNRVKSFCLICMFLSSSDLSFTGRKQFLINRKDILINSKV